MQTAGTAAYAPSRRRSPAHSDTESELVDGYAAAPSMSATTSGSMGSSAAGRPQRPGLSHNHTSSGSFVRLKRKTPSAVTSVDAGIALSGQPERERSIDQIALKTCFICYEEEGEGNASGKRWIHPCKCSLVAHEDCLLSWISISKPKASANKPVACPQCGTPYTINQRDFPLLNLVERVEDAWAKHVSKILVAGLGAGAWTLLSWYGIWAIKMFAGNRVAEQLLLRRWTKWLTAPLILPVLVLSRSHLLDSVLPFLPLTLVLNSSLPASYPYYTLEPFPLADLQISFPPNPALTLCLLPWVRAIYMACRRKLFQTLLGRRVTPLASPASPGPHHRTGQAQVNLPNEADFARNNQHADPDRFDFGLQNDGNIDQRRVVVTVASGARLLASSLIFPGAAALTGSLLLWLAKRQNSGKGWLGKLLGLGVAAMPTPSSWGLTTFLPPAQVVDPVWWRNTLGGFVLVVLKDFWSLTRTTMEMRRAASRRVQNQTFRSGLDV